MLADVIKNLPSKDTTWDLACSELSFVVGEVYQKGQPQLEDKLGFFSRYHMLAVNYDKEQFILSVSDWSPPSNQLSSEKPEGHKVCVGAGLGRFPRTDCEHLFSTRCTVMAREVEISHQEGIISWKAANIKKLGFSFFFLPSCLLPPLPSFLPSLLLLSFLFFFKVLESQLSNIY